MSYVLVVDDNQDNLYLLECLLSADGYTVRAARHGEEALAIARELPPALVISDVLMPIMDGFSLCRAMKTDPRFEEIPFVIYTATYTDPKDEAFALSLGAAEFIIKPAEPEVLRARLHAIFERQRAGSLQPVEPGALEQGPYLQQYNVVLIHKLEQKVAALERANHELRLKDLAIATSNDGIAMSDANGVITYANATLGRWIGKEPVHLLGIRFDDLVARDNAGGGEEERFEARLHVTAKPVRVLRVTVQRVNGGVGGPEAMMYWCQDISEERRLRDELVRLRQLESLGTFAAGVAHDFNNLLMSVYATLEMGSLPDLGLEERLELRELAVAGFERARDLTRRLLAFSKASSVRRCTVDLRRLLDESVSLALSGTSITWDLRCLVERPHVFGDPGQLSRVFSNLAVNSRQAMREHGALRAVVDIPGGAEAAPETRSMVRITLTDNGPGIPVEMHSRLFEPYFSTKTDGSGLGLATSQAIILEHGGSIEAAVTSGEGATFVVWLPQAAPDAPPAPTVGDVEPRVPNGERILVMDDKVSVRALTQRALERVGYSVVAVGNGEQALLEVGRALAARLPFDLAILDVTVKGGMGAVETLPAIRELDPCMPVMASTGYAFEDTASKLVKRGFATVLVKPYLVHELLSRVAAVLSSSVG